MARARASAERVADETPERCVERAPSRPDVHLAHELAPPTDAERTVLGPLATGAAFSAGTRRFRVAAAFATRAGAIPLVVEAVDDPSLRFAVELLRRDDGDAVQPVARTGSLALFVANGGDGSRATQEAQGLAVLALAREIAAHGAPTPPLSTRSERAARHPMGVFHVPLDLAAASAPASGGGSSR